MSSPILEVQDLHVEFNGVKAADGVSLKVNEGDFLAIIGPNGSGKTTLLNLCTGYIRPNSGEIRLNGQKITGLAPRKITRKGVARAFQIPQLFGDQTVLNNTMLAVAAREGLWTMVKPLGSAARRREAEGLLELVGLEREARRIGSTLPEGHRKLLDIALALALRPKLLLLDEPTSGVSTIERFSLMETLMSALKERKITALFVEHDMEVVARYANRVLAWNAGKVMAEGSPEAVFKDERVLKNVIGVA
ncbi:ABC-type branched-subunit amino acid transport system ATPase component OS=Castellaniella defragrans OX=75697 GN=HNR28_001879 PE=4 SV=1 [Castellaniella defragrans]